MFVWANDLALLLVAHPGFDTPREFLAYPAGVLRGGPTKHLVRRRWSELCRGRASRRLKKKRGDITMLVAEVQNVLGRLAVGCGVCRKKKGSHTRE